MLLHRWMLDADPVDSVGAWDLHETEQLTKTQRRY